MIRLLRKYESISLPAKASLWFVICSILQKGIAFITTPIFTRILSLEEFGVYGVFNSWYSILTVVATLELATGVYNKAMIKYGDDKDGYTSSTLFLSSCVVAAVYLFCFIFQDVLCPLMGLNITLLTMLFAEIFFLNVMAFWTIRQRFEYKYRSVVALTLAASILGPLLSIILIRNHSSHRVEYRVWGMLAVHIALYSVVGAIIAKRGKKLYHKEYWRYALHFNLPLIPHYLSLLILNQSDRIMVDRICGSDAAALYTLAYQVAIVMNIITNAVNASFSPWAYQNIHKGEHEKIGKLTSEIVLMIGLVCALFALLAPEFIMIMGDEPYMEAIWAIPPITMSIVFNMIYSLISNYAFYYEKTQFIMVGSAVSAVTNLILNWIFIPRYGFAAAGYTTLFCYIIYAVVHYVFMIKVCRENGIEQPFQTMMIWGIAGSVIGFTFIALLLYRATAARYLLIMGFLVVGFIYREKVMKILKSFRRPTA